MTERPTNWAGVAFGVALASVAAFQQFKLPPVLPTLLERYGYDRTLAGGFMSVYALIGLLLSIGIGRWLERNGLHRGLVIATGIMLAGNLLGLLLPERGWVVLGGRALEGIGFAFAAIAGPTLAGASAGTGHRAIAIALVSAWIPIGQIAAGLLAPLALAAGHWQWLWLVAIAATLGLAAWSHRLAESGQLAMPAPHPGESGGAGWQREERLALVAGAGIFMAWACQYFAYMTWLPQYLVEVRALGSVAAIFGYLLPVVVLVLFNLLTGEALRRGVPVAPLLAAGATLQAIVWWLTMISDSGGFGVALLVAYGVAAGVTPTCLFALPGAVLRRAAGASAFAWIMTGRNIGVFLGPILLAWAIQRSGGWGVAVPIFGAITTVCAVATIALAFAMRRRASEAQGTSR
jgi:MFS family permease